MKKFIKHSIVFLIIFLTIAFSVTTFLSKKVEKQNFENYNTENNVIITPKKKHFDYVFLGLSHARNFSRHMNHHRVEKILGISFINFGKGGGRGNVANQYTFLRHFYDRKNTTDNILYVISLPMMYADRLDKNSYGIEREAFRASFFFRFLFGPAINKGEKLYTYFRYKYTAKWHKKYKPYSAKSKDNILKEYDEKKIKDGFKRAYINGLEWDTFERNKKVILKTLDFAKKKGIQTTFLITPSTFGKWPGHDEVLQFLEENKAAYNLKILDYSEIYKKQKQYFYDHHHLNTFGVETFCRDYLKPDLVK